MNKTVFFNKFRRLFGFVLTISLLGNVFAASAQNARISIKSIRLLAQAIFILPCSRHSPLRVQLL